MTNILGNDTIRYINQSLIMINRQMPSKDDEYSRIIKKNKFAAMRDLKDSGYKLWDYLSSQADTNGSFNWALGYKPVSNETGMSRSSYFRACKELEDKG